MSTIKFLRLTVPLCGAIVLANAPRAFAQGDVAEGAATPPAYPAPAQTPEAAGERFYQFLSTGIVMDGQSSGVPFNWPRADVYLSAISREQMMAMANRPQMGGTVEQLFAALAQQKDEPQYQGVIVGKEGEQTFVEVSPVPAKKRAVVVIAEDGGFRVDIKATYGRWNDLSGEKLDVAWYQATGIEAPTLANNPEFQRARENTRRSSCQVNLKQAMLGILQYSQDYDQTYPTAPKWIDNVMPYVKSEQIFRCPSLPEGSNYGYALNQNLAGLSMAQMNNVAQTVAIYETEDLTRSAFGAGEERAYRHLGGSNIAFADGHIKWFAQGDEPEDQVSFKP